jgi:hypothetical protein
MWGRDKNNWIFLSNAIATTMIVSKKQKIPGYNLMLGSVKVTLVANIGIISLLFSNKK